MRTVGLLLFLSPLCFGQGRLPAHVKLMDGPSLKVENRKPTRVNEPIASPVADGRCAHILVKPVSPEVDPKALIKLPDPDPAMPTFRGLPACPQDIR